MSNAANATNDPEPVDKNEEPTASNNAPDEEPPEPADIDRESR